MASSRMIATRKQQVFMAHICSNCGFPVITVVQIQSKAEKSYTFSQSKAAQIASETADNAIEHEIHRIESCGHTKSPLMEKEKKPIMISPGYFCESSISGFASHCPNCSNIEPWKSATPALSKINMDALTEENFPVVFKDANEAEKWARDYILGMIADIENKRKDPLLVRQAEISALQSIKTIQSLEKQLADIPERKEKELLSSQLQEYKAYQNQLGLLDVKGKKEANAQIKVLELKLADISKAIADKADPLQTVIKQEQSELLPVQAIAFGCTGAVTTQRSGYTMSYHYEPNPISEQLSAEDPEAAEEKTEINHVDTARPLPEENNDAFSQDEIIFCRRCGFKLLPGSIYCTQCGVKVK